MQRLSTLEELQAEAKRFVGELKVHTDRATLVTLSGELGAGKTSFVQGVGSALGIDSSITSPTFVLEKIYQLTNQSFERLVHIDAYRLNGGAELVPLGFWQTIAAPRTLIMLEWPERVNDGLPQADVRITLTVADEGRDISYA